MIRGIVLMNPRKKTKMKARRKSYRTRSNPRHSAAMRRKIGAAVKRANATRRAGGARRSKKSRRTAVVVRSASLPARRSARRSVRRSVVSRTYRARRSSGGGRSISMKSIISKDNMLLAGGVIGSNLLSRVLMSRFGNMLPMASNPWVNSAYVLGISFVGAKVASKFSKPLAEGLLIGGLVAVINNIVSTVMPAQVAAPAAPAAPVSEYLGAYGTLGVGPVSQQVATAPHVDAYLDSAPAFEGSAWGN